MAAGTVDGGTLAADGAVADGCGAVVDAGRGRGGGGGAAARTAPLDQVDAEADECEDDDHEDQPLLAAG